MSPKGNSSISDRGSEKEKPRRGRPSVPPASVLKAADALFASADSPGTVTMDAIATEAGVGKGTLFRAFGSREGLLNALWAAKLAALRDGFQEGNSELGPGVLKSEHYKWMHGLLQRFIEAAAPKTKVGNAVFAGHVLLAGLHIDLVEEMIAGGLSLDAIRQSQAAHARAVIDSAQCME